MAWRAVTQATAADLIVNQWHGTPQKEESNQADMLALSSVALCQAAFGNSRAECNQPFCDAVIKHLDHINILQTLVEYSLRDLWISIQICREGARKC